MAMMCWNMSHIKAVALLHCIWNAEVLIGDARLQNRHGALVGDDQPGRG
jgi:hypothetical protein